MVVYLLSYILDYYYVRTFSDTFIGIYYPFQVWRVNCLVFCSLRIFVYLCSNNKSCARTCSPFWNVLFGCCCNLLIMCGIRWFFCRGFESHLPPLKSRRKVFTLRFLFLPPPSPSFSKQHKKGGHLIDNRLTFNKYHPKIYELLSPNTSSKITTIQSVMVVLNTYLVIGEKGRGYVIYFEKIDNKTL